MPSDENDLQAIMLAQENHDMAPNVTSLVVSEMKQSLMYQMNWEELLQSAPTAISCMGACFVASSSPRAAVKLKPRAGEQFQHLRYSSIQANLTECGNLGRFAFLEAEKGMGTIQLTSQVINGKINDIILCLGDPASAKKTLKPQLNTLKTGAQQCLASALAMDKQFGLWLTYVCEIHTACVEEEQNTSDQIHSNAISFAISEAQLDNQKSFIDEAKKAQDLMRKDADIAAGVFKKASDEFPNGWGIIKQQVVLDLASAVTTTINQVVPAILSVFHPISMVKFGANSVKDKFLGENRANARATNDTRATSKTTHPTSCPATQDPAYATVIKVDIYLALMNVIVAGKDNNGNINWETARGDGTKESGKSSIKFLLTMLKDTRDRFIPIATQEEPSTDLIDILKTCEQIAFEISLEVGNSGNASSSYPAKDSDKVKKWQADFAKCYAKANRLLATAKTIPGTAPHGIPLMADPVVQTAQINAKTAHAQAVLESAKNRLTTTQHILTTAQDNYVKTTNMLLEQQNQLAQMQGNLNRLTDSNLTLTEIKAILIECIKLVVNLKQQISNLVRFFQAMCIIIDTIVKFHVDPFVITLKEVVAVDGTDPHEDLRVGNYTLTDLQRSMIYNATVTLRAYFSVFGEVARMWVRISQEDIFPGLKLCDELSITTEDPVTMNSKVGALNAWSRGASDRIAELSRAKQKQIISGLENRIEEVRETTRMIQAPPPETLKAISDGVEVTKAVVQKSIRDRSATSSLSRFAAMSIDD